MGGIKYYQLAKGEELPDEFCVVRDIGGEPSEYTFYAPEAENAKLRELVLCLLTCHSDDSSACDKCPVNGGHGILEFEDFCDSLLDRVHELRVEVDG